MKSNDFNLINIITVTYGKILTITKKAGFKTAILSCIIFLLFCIGMRLIFSDVIPTIIDQQMTNTLLKYDKQKKEERTSFIIKQQMKIEKVQQLLQMVTDDSLCNHAAVQVFHDGKTSLNNKLDFQYAELFAASSNDSHKVSDVLKLENTALMPYYSYMINNSDNQINCDLTEFRSIDIEMYCRLKKQNTKHIFMKLYYDSDHIQYYILSYSWNNNYCKSYNYELLNKYTQSINVIMNN